MKDEDLTYIVRDQPLIVRPDSRYARDTRGEGSAAPDITRTELVFKHVFLEIGTMETAYLLQSFGGMGFPEVLTCVRSMH